MTVDAWCESDWRRSATQLTVSMKFFAHPDLDQFKKDELDGWFAKVMVDKPKESRSGKSLFICECRGKSVAWHVETTWEP